MSLIFCLGASRLSADSSAYIEEEGQEEEETEEEETEEDRAEIEDEEIYG